MTVTMSLFSLALVWASGWCAHVLVRRQRQSEFGAHLKKLDKWKHFPSETAKEQLNRIAQRAERRQVNG